MMRLIQVLVGLLAIVFDVVGIAYFSAWLSRTDWLMGHIYGPASYIITALWTCAAGIVATALWAALVLLRRFKSTAQPHKRNVGLLLQAVVLVLLLLPVGLIATMTAFELPHARLELQIQRMKAGDATVAELVAALDSPEHRVRWNAIEALRKLGSQAAPAVPGLARTLNDPSPTLNRHAARALAAIGPGAQPAIPALVEVITREKGVASGIACRALTSIGPAALRALEKLLSHEDRDVRMRAAAAIGNMGPKANAAIPALHEAVDDDDGRVRQSAIVALERIENARPVAE